jgi:programmed cell death protein 10
MQAEAGNPGLAHEFVDHLLDAAQSKGGADITEKLLRAANTDIQGTPRAALLLHTKAVRLNAGCGPGPTPRLDYRLEGKTPELTELATKTKALKVSLTRVP